MSWDAAQLEQAIVQHNVYWQNNERNADYEYDCMVDDGL